MFVLQFHSLAIVQLEHWANWHKRLSSAEDYTNMYYYNLCDIKSKQVIFKKTRGSAH